MVFLVLVDDGNRECWMEIGAGLEVGIVKRVLPSAERVWAHPIEHSTLDICVSVKVAAKEWRPMEKEPVETGTGCVEIGIWPRSSSHTDHI